MGCNMLWVGGIWVFSTKINGKKQFLPNSTISTWDVQWNVGSMEIGFFCIYIAIFGCYGNQNIRHGWVKITIILSKKSSAADSYHFHILCTRWCGMHRNRVVWPVTLLSWLLWQQKIRNVWAKMKKKHQKTRICQFQPILHIMSVMMWAERDWVCFSI